MYPDDWNSEQKSIHFIIVLLLLQSMLMTWLVFVSLFIPISELLSPLQLFFSVPVCYMSVVILQVIFKYPRKSIEKYEKQKSESTDSTGDWV
jgi:membrane protein implicated in regulation of membrane protease activity